MLEYCASSKKFALICGSCGYVMPLDNMIIIPSLDLFLAPCV